MTFLFLSYLFDWYSVFKNMLYVIVFQSTDSNRLCLADRDPPLSQTKKSSGAEAGPSLFVRLKHEVVLLTCFMLPVSAFKQDRSQISDTVFCIYFEWR